MTEFSRPIDIPIKILTPVWTGDASGRANGLKMSGIIGGLRHNFEMLVRKHGGQTCDITGLAGQRCNYEKNQSICPACAVFGCTGLQRSFRLGRLDLKPVSFTAPLKDWKSLNRQHDGTKYNHPVVITKWLAVSAGHPKDMKDIDDGEALEFLARIRPTWPKDKNGEIKFSIVPLNNFLKNKDICLTSLLHYLLGFMASYTGLGAKVNQGWGVFCLDNNENMESLHEKGTAELAKLIEVFNFAEKDGNDGLPDARDCFAATWTLSNRDPVFEWPNRIPKDKPYLCTGFAMAYRLRRYMKFYENDNPPKKLFVLPTGLSWDTDWRNLGNALSGKWSRANWKETLPFIRALFGRDESEDKTKTAGVAGVSHLYKKNGAWRVRLFGRLPPRYYYRAWDGNRETSVWLDWNADIVRKGIIDRFEDLLTEQKMWKKGDSYTLKTGGDL